MVYGSNLGEAGLAAKELPTELTTTAVHADYLIHARFGLKRSCAPVLSEG